MLLEGAAVKVVCALWSGHAGAAAGCCFKVLLSERCARFGVGMLVPLQGDALAAAAPAITHVFKIWMFKFKFESLELLLPEKFPSVRLL